MTKKQVFFHPQRFFLDNVPKQTDGTCYVLNSEYGELWAAYGEQEQEIERLRGNLSLAEEGLASATQEIERLNKKCGALAYLLYGPSTYRPLNPLEEEIERLREALRGVKECTGTSTRQYHIASDALTNTHEPECSHPADAIMTTSEALKVKCGKCGKLLTIESTVPVPVYGQKSGVSGE
jgi:DNA repair exonuclease SbcCD ATPase subunit